MRNQLSSLGIICLCLIAVIASSSRVQAQESMTVVHVSGQVRLASAKEGLERGKTFTGKDQLAFGDKRGHIIAWQPKVGLVFLHPTEGASDHGGGLLGNAQGFVDSKPIIAQGPRLQQFSNSKQLKPHFESRKYLVLGKTWLIAKPPFQAKGDTVFLLKYRNLKENFQSSHPITWSGDSLRLDQASLLELNGRALDPKEISDYHLMWYSMKTRKFGEITYFDFVFADEAQVKADIQQLLELMKDNSAQEKRDAVRKLIGLGYGEPDAHNYAQWMAQHFPALK